MPFNGPGFLSMLSRGTSFFLVFHCSIPFSRASYKQSVRDRPSGERREPTGGQHGSTMQLISLAHEIDVEPRSSKVERTWQISDTY
jgi:hypothetical protein